MSALAYEIIYNILELLRESSPKTSSNLYSEICSKEIFSPLNLQATDVASLLSIMDEAHLVKPSLTEGQQTFEISTYGIKVYYISKKERERIMRKEEIKKNPITISLKPAKGYENVYNAFFEQYNLIEFVIASDFIEKDLKKETEKVCRFCGKKYPEVRFQNRAHLVPEMLGNKTLFSDFECDSCNHRFGKMYENDLANYLGISRTLTQTKGKEKIPTFTSSGKTIKAKTEKLLDETSIIISRENTNDDSILTDPKNGKITVRFKRLPFKPLHVFKALLKIAISVLAEEDMKNYQLALEFVLDKTKFMENGYVMNGYYLPFSFNMPPHIFIFRKRDKDAHIPTHVVAIYFGNSVFAIPMPLHNEDIKKWRENPNLELNPFPPLFTEFTHLENVPILPFREDYSSKEIVYDSVQEIIFQLAPEDLERISAYDSVTGEINKSKFDPAAITQIIMRKTNAPIDPKALFEAINKV